MLICLRVQGDCWLMFKFRNRHLERIKSLANNADSQQEQWRASGYETDPLVVLKLLQSDDSSSRARLL